MFYVSLITVNGEYEGVHFTTHDERHFIWPMNSKSSGQGMRGEEIQQIFGDDSVVKLENELRALEDQLTEHEAQLDKETEADRIDDLLEKLQDIRRELSAVHRKLAREQRAFTEISQGKRRVF